MKKSFSFFWLILITCTAVAVYTDTVSSKVLICELAMAVPRKNISAAVARNEGEIVSSPSNIILTQKDTVLNDDAELLSSNVGGDVDTITVAITSDAGGNDTTVNLWNTTALGNLITDNGGGANTIDYGWDDGTFNGAVDNGIVTTGRQNKGLICWRVDFELFVDGLSDPANIAILRPVWLTYDAFGRGTPVSMNTAARHTRQDFDKGIVNMYCIQNVSPYTQAVFVMPSSAGAVTNNVANVTFYFKRSTAR